MIRVPGIWKPERLLLIAMVVYPALVGAGMLLQHEKLQVAAFSLAVLLPMAYLSLFRLNLLMFVTVLTIPLSFKLVAGGTAISFPAEILTALIAVLFLAYRLLSEEKADARILKHPLTLLVLLDMGWLVLTSLFSEMPVISLKRVVVRLAFMVAFYFLFTRLFRDTRNIGRVWLLYAIGMIIPILSTIHNHSQYGFAKAVSYMMTVPFYNDHTQYATCIAYVLPVLAFLIAMPEKAGLKRAHRLYLIPLAGLLLVGELFSWSRAAWLSIIAALVFALCVVFLRFRLWHFMLITLVALGFAYHYRVEIYQRIEKVDAVSRAKDVEEHLESVVNIQTDASNLERINRWSCAISMFRDRPLTGFGPGTYQFVYGSYQVTPEMTRISTNHGDKGNAHSEYLTYLSETGIVGFIIFNILILMTISKGIRIYRTAERKEVRWLAMALLIGFVTYFFHGLFNSFIDTDKASVLVYGSIAALVVLDVHHSKNPN